MKLGCYNYPPYAFNSELWTCKKSHAVSNLRFWVLVQRFPASFITNPHPCYRIQSVIQSLLYQMALYFHSVKAHGRVHLLLALLLLLSPALLTRSSLTLSVSEFVQVSHSLLLYLLASSPQTVLAIDEQLPLCRRRGKKKLFRDPW